MNGFGSCRFEKDADVRDLRFAPSPALDFFVQQIDLFVSICSNRLKTVTNGRFFLNKKLQFPPVDGIEKNRFEADPGSVAHFPLAGQFMKSYVSCVKAILLAVVCFGMSGNLTAEDYLGGQLTITPLPPPTTRTSSLAREGTTHGYMEYRFHINNKSDRPHQVAFTLSGNSGGRGEITLSHASTAVVVEAKSEAMATILQPPVSLGYAPLSISIDNGRNIPMSFSAMQHGFQRYRSGGMVGNILVSNKITANQRELLTRGTLEEDTPPESPDAAAGMGMGMMGGMGGIPGFSTTPELHAIWQSEVPTDQWSDQWLSYTRFDCVVVNHDDMLVLKPEAFRAVRRYVEMGGMLVVLDARSAQPSNWPKHWVEMPKLFRGVVSETRTTDSSAGALYVGEQLPDGLTELMPMPTGLTYYRALQGEAFVMSGGNEESCIKHLRAEILSIARRNDTILRFAENGAETFERIAPLGISYSIPVRPLVVLVIFFALLIGPVNMLVLGFFRRRVWLIWTIPLTSVAASCLVLGLVVFSEGVKKVTSVKSVTILDQRRGEAMTSGIVGLYRTFAPPGGITFSNSTEVTPAIGNMDGLSLGLQTYGEQRLTQNWIRPRIPAFYLLRKAASSNVRLVFDWHGEPTVTNGLGVRIAKLNVVSPEGKTYTVELLEAGQKANMVLVSGPNIDIEHPAFQASSSFDNQLNRNSLPTQGRGTYTANIEGDSPFLEPGIDNMKPYTQINTIYGIFSGEGMPE